MSAWLLVLLQFMVLSAALNYQTEVVLHPAFIERKVTANIFS